MATQTTRKLLGTEQGKEYYLVNVRDLETQQVTTTIEWRVPDIREAVQAEPGHLILAADYSQIEVKLMAFLSGDPGLIAAINSKQDVHSYNATKVFGTKFAFTYEEMEVARKQDAHPRHNELSLIRSRVKAVTFGVPLV